MIGVVWIFRVPNSWACGGSGGVRAYRRALDRLRAAESVDPRVRAGILQAMALTEEPAALRALDLAGGVSRHQMAGPRMLSNAIRRTGPRVAATL